MSDIAKGHQITAAFEYINQLFNECQRIIFKIDNQMAPEWKNLFGNRIVKDVSASLQEPDSWVLDAIFRFYEGKEDKIVNKCVVLTFWGDEIEQPVITAGKIIYSDIDKRDHWDLFHLWFVWSDTNENDNNQFEMDGKINVIQSDSCKHIKEAQVFSWPLVSIIDEETLIEKIIKPLKEL